MGGKRRRSRRERERDDNILAGINLPNGPRSRLPSMWHLTKHLSLAGAGVVAELPRCGNLTMANCCTQIEILSKLLCCLKVQFYCFQLGSGREREGGGRGDKPGAAAGRTASAAIGNKPRPICTRTMNPCGALCHIRRKCTR